MKEFTSRLLCHVRGRLMLYDMRVYGSLYGKEGVCTVYNEAIIIS